MALPISMASAVEIGLRSQPFSASHPTAKAAGTKPKRYPDVGPINTARLPVPLAKTGRPLAPSIRYAMTARAPRREPRAIPTRRIAKVWPVTGTGVNGRGTAICADNAIRTEPASTKRILLAIDCLPPPRAAVAKLCEGVIERTDITFSLLR